MATITLSKPQARLMPKTPPINDNATTLGEELAEELPACRAERGADGYFSLARGAAGEEEIGHVHTGDQQNETDGAHSAARGS